MNHTLRILTPFLLLFLAIYFTLASCAMVSSPGGGPKDTIAPRLDTSFPPNFSTGFTASEINLIFDEYITLKSPSQQISISPPLNEKQKITSVGREITISWEDTLLENTTYIISFGNSITDFTEGNVNDDFKYVFSTGTYIDSLEVSGIVSTKDGKGAKDIMVALYDYRTLKSQDSIPYKNMPTYYAYTDETGNFKLTNLKYSEFHVVAFEDIRQNFKLNSGSERIGFMNDTLVTTLKNPRLNIDLFVPEGTKRFYGARHVAYGKIEVAYSYPLDSFAITPLVKSDTTQLIVLPNKTRDTARIWYNPAWYQQDSISLLITDKEGPKDTATVLFKSFDNSNHTLKVPSTNLRKGDPILLKSPGPVSAVDTSAIVAYSDGDTLQLTLSDSLYAMGKVALYPQKYPKDITLNVPTGSVRTLTGSRNDSLTAGLKVLTRDELGSLDFVIKSDSADFPLILKVSTEAGRLVHQSSFYGNTSVPFKNYFAGKYKAEIVLDTDANGKWSTGNYLKRLQPEKIIYYQEPIEIRANWELELEWQIDLEDQ